MTTPICDFVRDYARSGALRLHMPGHKGMAHLGMEILDITEIPGADVLYHAEGILRESQENAGKLFDTGATFYSTEGSSLSIRAMLMLLKLYAQSRGQKATVAACRNAHKTFITAAALLNLPVTWLYPEESRGVTACLLSPEAVEAQLDQMTEAPTALYVTSPDYLGNVADIRKLSEICKRRGILLLVDNAHGAYLHFLPESRHPIALGADLCCDSAHKTLPVLTGGAYLHVSQGAPALFREQAAYALSLFASTSPSYLILQSLDYVNLYLAEGYRERLAAFAEKADGLKARLRDMGYPLIGDEPLKLTLAPKSYGYTGTELAALLEERGIVCEFADPDYTVMMLTPELTDAQLEALEAALASIFPRASVAEMPPPICRPRQRRTPAEALFAPRQTLPAEACLGKVMADISVSCPPAVPILICGEEITPEALSLLQYYGTTHCCVIL